MAGNAKSISLPPLSGRELAEAAAADFESFFYPSFAFPIPIAVEAVNHACIRKTASQTCIVIPKEMADDVIETPAKLFFHLLILGHEIAHFVHEHVQSVSAQTKEQFKALEYWADFYGAKVMMMLVTYGPLVRSRFKAFFPGETVFEEPLDAIGDAVGLLVGSVYGDSDRYPPRLLRALLVSNGVTSFLRHDMDQSKLDSIWYYSVFKRVTGSEPVRELKLLVPESAEGADDLIETSRTWHREMQGDRAAITFGFRLQFAKYLHTSFDQTDEEIAQAQAERLAEMRKDGHYDI